MSVANPSNSAARMQSENALSGNYPSMLQDEMAAMLRMLTLSEGTFSLSVAVCNSPDLRNRLIEEMQTARPQIEVIKLPAGVIDIYGYVVDHAKEDQVDGLFLVGLEACISSRETDHLALQSLNPSRDLWDAKFHRPVVFWLAEYATRELTEMATDFWRYLSHRFAFIEGDLISPPPARDTFASNYLFTSQLRIDEKRARIEELRSRLSQADWLQLGMLVHLTNWTIELSELLRVIGESDAAVQVCQDLLPATERSGGEAARALLWGKIADVMQDRGEFDETLRIRRDVQLPIYDRLGDVRSKAIVMSRIADVLQVRGDFDDALRIRYEDELPVCKQLGDIRGTAITMGKIADVLQARGNLDEALRIHREEELPVYEQLGDIRAKAVTMGKIAVMLQDRGDLREALRIHTEDALPVYERLGDFRMKAITMGNIADILQAEGNLSEALRIRREEELPIYERFSLTKDLLVCREWIALYLLKRGAPGDRDEASQLLAQARMAAEKLGLADAERIRQLQQELSL